MTRALLLLLALGLVGCGERDAYWRGYADGVRQGRAIKDAFTLGCSAAQEHGKARAAINDTIHGNVMSVADTTSPYYSVRIWYGPSTGSYVARPARWDTTGGRK